MKGDKSNLSVVHSNFSEGKMAGVAPKTEDEKALYEAMLNLPEPSSKSNLTDNQKFWWYWIGGLLIQTKDFAEIDLVHLQKAAFWMDVRCQAIGEANTKGYNGGMVQTFATGARQISPDLTLVEKADKHLDEVSAAFGWSILHRKKLGEVQKAPEGQMNLFDQLTQMKKTGNF